MTLRNRRQLPAIVALGLLLTLAAPLPVGAASTVVSRGTSAQDQVALTFDDGWDRRACARIAMTLRAHDVTGTFFINGSRLLKAPRAWRRILRGQHIGNHAMRHRNLLGLSNAVVRREIHKNEVTHERILGRPMLKLFRPPYGAHDQRILRMAGRLGYKRTVLWSVNSGDWTRSTTVDGVIANSTGAAPGSIILMHCSDNSTPAALPTIIRHYKARGLQMVGLKQLLAP